MNSWAIPNSEVCGEQSWPPPLQRGSSRRRPSDAWPYTAVVLTRQQGASAGASAADSPLASESQTDGQGEAPRQTPSLPRVCSVDVATAPRAGPLPLLAGGRRRRRPSACKLMNKQISEHAVAPPGTRRRGGDAGGGGARGWVGGGEEGVFVPASWGDRGPREGQRRPRRGPRAPPVRRLSRRQSWSCLQDGAGRLGPPPIPEWADTRLGDGAGRSPPSPRRPWSRRPPRGHDPTRGRRAHPSSAQPAAGEPPRLQARHYP